MALPTLLAYNVSPSATFLNQALALAWWGLLVAALAWAAPLTRESGRAASVALALPAAILGLVALCVWLSASLGSLPWSLAVSALGVLAAAVVAAAAGARIGVSDIRLAQAVWKALCLGLVMAGVAQVLIALVQVFAPDWADGQWIARTTLPGRTIGNLRQPNHVCTLLLLAMVAAAALMPAPAMPSTLRGAPLAPSGRRARVATGLFWVLLAIFSWALVATASRTALIGLVILVLWALLDRSLSTVARRALLCTPLLYAAAWALMAGWAEAAQKTFGAQQRLGESDLSASRLGIWRDTLQLIAEHPWTGVGFGEFNFAWTLSVMPNRPVAFFDHTHNLLLQWAVELGIPVALLLTALSGAALWRLARTAFGRNADGTRTRLLRPALACLVVLAVHSQLEYPLWYAYFLLPSAFILGFGLALDRGIPPSGMASGDTVPDNLSSPDALAEASAFSRLRLAAMLEGTLAWRGLAAGLLLTLGAVAALTDYQRVVRVFAHDVQQPLAQRIAEGQRSWFFAHHADYAAATVSPEPAQEMEALRRAAHYLLDTRLMMAWADAHASSADLPRARYLAARLREFRNPLSLSYLEACTKPVDAIVEPAYQCRGSDPLVKLRWTDFR